MKKQLLIILLIFTGDILFAQTECNFAVQEALSDYKEEDFTFHSLPFSPVDNTFLYVLREDYNINWRFISSDEINYYTCYDSVLTELLKTMYGESFLNEAQFKADSLDQLDNWKNHPEYPGGMDAMLEFINNRLKMTAQDLINGFKGKIYIQFNVTESGGIDDIRILKGGNTEVNNQLKEIISKMPKWNPAYLYGKPIRERMVVPIYINLSK